MKKIFLGKFETDGNLVVTDPCYELKTWCNKHIKVKPGAYNVYVIYGQLKEPFFPIDAVKGFYRNAQLIIEHESYSRFKYTKTKTNISVDSGQAGFFNINTYKKDSPEVLKLPGYPYSFFRENIFSKTLDIERNKKLLQEKDSNELYARMKKHFKDSDKETADWFNKEIEMAKYSLKESRKILKNKKYPHYIKEKESKDFYEIMCDKTSREHRADVSSYGAVSSAGLGDGGYNLFISRNTKKEIIGAYLSFIDIKEFK